MRNIPFNDIHPFVRYVQLLTVTEEMPFLNMAAYDNRLFYTVAGQGLIRVNGTEYPMKPGCLMLWRAGMPYELLSGSGDKLQMIGCNFDFTQGQRRLSAPIPPGKTSPAGKTVSPFKYDAFQEAEVLDCCRIADVEELNHVMYFENMQSEEELLRQALEEYSQQRLMASARLSGLILLVLIDAARTAALPGGSSHRKDSRADEILQYIRRHYREELCNSYLGELFNYHPNYISQLITAYTGMSLHQYLLRYRIQQAIHYLQNTDYPASQIAELTGFRDYNYFLKYFKKLTGCTTRRFRP